MLEQGSIVEGKRSLQDFDIEIPATNANFTADGGCDSDGCHLNLWGQPRKGTPDIGVFSEPFEAGKWSGQCGPSTEYEYTLCTQWINSVTHNIEWSIMSGYYEE